MVKEQLLECVMGMYGGLDSVLDDIVYIAESGDPPRNYGYPPSKVAEVTKGENFGKLKNQIKKEIFYR